MAAQPISQPRAAVYVRVSDPLPFGCRRNCTRT